MKKSSFGMVLFFFLPLICSPSLAHAKSINTAIYALGPVSDSAKKWMIEKFDFVVGDSYTKRPADTNVFWTTYKDIYTLAGPSEYFVLKDFATSNGLNAEEILLHAKQDYKSSLSTAWSQMDKFDKFEGKNGILKTTDDIKYTDLTDIGYAGSTPLSNNIYLGYEEAFAEANFTFQTFGLNVKATWEYWNGNSWAALTVNDATNNFTSNGKISFLPPSNWARRVLNGSRNKYFVRIRFAGASTYPVTSSIKGDDWLRGASSLCRGWDATSPSIINPSSELAYNPTPPENSSAKFRYQARIPMWAPNYFIANPADYQVINGVKVRTWTAYLVKIMSDMVAQNYSGILCDDGERDVASDGIASSLTDFADKTANSWNTESINRYKDIVTGLHKVAPETKVGVNAKSKNLVKQGDWNLLEYVNYVTSVDYPRNIIPADVYQQTTMTYDDYLPINNPTGIKGVFIYADTSDTASFYQNYPSSTAKSSYQWDRSNRGPMLALTKHLIASNDSTYFSYFSRGGFYYSERDEIFLKDGTTLHLAKDAVPDVSLVKRWGMYFPAIGVDFGLPDVNGHNAGVRDLQWRKGVDIGGIQDVWRRDYTNAVVLHRPATWSSNISEYDTASVPISLNATYYPLSADGFTGAGITSIALRTGEGAILMKAPISQLGIQGTPAEPLPAPQNPRKISATPE